LQGNRRDDLEGKEFEKERGENAPGLRKVDRESRIRGAIGFKEKGKSNRLPRGRFMVGVLTSKKNQRWARMGLKKSKGGTHKRIILFVGSRDGGVLGTSPERGTTISRRFIKGRGRKGRWRGGGSKHG